MAKAAVAEARVAGVEMPKNAQGLAASAIAKGADPASVFAAQVAALAPPDPAPSVPDATDTTDATAPADAASDIYAKAQTVLNASTADEIALDLLISAED
jgi:hypothetical protein